MLKIEINPETHEIKINGQKIEGDARETNKDAFIAEKQLMELMKADKDFRGVLLSIIQSAVEAIGTRKDETDKQVVFIKTLAYLQGEGILSFNKEFKIKK